VSIDTRKLEIDLKPVFHRKKISLQLLGAPSIAVLCLPVQQPLAQAYGWANWRGQKTPEAT
jgi:hypothetical protein